MKKLFILITLIFAMSLSSKSQPSETLVRTSDDIYLVRNYDLSTLSGNDTSFYFSIRMPVVKGWSIQISWTGVTGEGTMALEVTNFSLTRWTPYTDSPSVTITGASGVGAWEDYMFNWRHARLKLTKGTLSAGNLTVLINVR